MSDTELLIKLFDTLKDASKETQQMCLAILQNQNNISNFMDNIPIQELKDTLKEHSKEAAADMDVCTETIETTSHSILERVKVIEGKIGKMILTVLVVFALFSSAVLIGTLIQKSDKSTDIDIENLLENHEIKENKKFKEILEKIEELHKKK